MIRLAIARAIVGSVIFMGMMNGMASAQDPDWDKIKKEAEAKTAAAVAQKAQADAEMAALAAEKALADAKKEPDAAQKALADKLAAAKAAKDLSDADKAASDAQKAKADASLAALKAQIGEVPDSGIKGDVTIKEKAGVIEAHLLSAKALGTAADRVVADLPDVQKTILLYASADVPTFQALIAFRVQEKVVSAAFADAIAVSDKAAPKEFAPAAIGLGLDAVTKLLGFFRTDYTVGGVDVSIDDSAFVQALAGRIVDKNKGSVLLPSLYNAGALSDSGKKILDIFTDLSKKKAACLSRMTVHDEAAATFTEQAGKEADATKKADLLKKAKQQKEASDALKTAVAVYDNFFTKLTAADDKGLAPLTSVVRESVLADILEKDNRLLVVKLQKAGGAYYTKKNLWTFFGGMPFYNAGGVVVSYVLLGGKEGEVVKSGLVPIFGGFIRENKLQESVNGTKE